MFDWGQKVPLKSFQLWLVVSSCRELFFWAKAGESLETRIIIQNLGNKNKKVVYYPSLVFSVKINEPECPH